MYDNGLVEYYKNYATSDGRLPLSKLTEASAIRKEYTGDKHTKIKCFELNNQKYYVKNASVGETNAEILLSQIYAKLGFKSAIYTPTDQFEVVSQNVMGENCGLARDVFIAKTEQLFAERDKQEGKQGVFYRMSDYRNFLFNFESYGHFFTKQGAEQYLKMRLFDVATFNHDRHFSNFIARQNQDGLIDEIISFDYGAGADKYVKNVCDSYLNGNCCDYSENIIDYLKSNCYSRSVILPSTLADQVGSVNVSEISKDVYEQIGYKIDEDYVDRVAHNMEDTVNLLLS